MKLFEDEAAMQKWLEKEIDENEGIAHLVDDFESEVCAAGSPVSKKIFETYKYCLASTCLLEIIARDQNISLTANEKLRPDILAFAPNEQSIVVIELKNIAGPTRQAGTELSAYCAEINNYLPFISDADIVNVIISNEWPTLLRKHVAQDILWRRRKLICLLPYIDGSEIRLKVVTPNALGCSEVDQKLAVHHLGGYQLCLYDHQRCGEDPDRTRLDRYVPQMRSAMAALATKGNLSGNHGFAFLWKDRRKDSLAPYSICISNVAAFNRLDRFLIDLPENEQLTPMQEQFLRLASKFAPGGYGPSLNELTNEAKRFLQGFCSPRMEGFITWPSLLNEMDSRADYIAFVAWGFFGELHLDRLQRDYEATATPDFYSPKLGLALIDDVISNEMPFVDLASWDYEDQN
jgi:hypothetical protein